MADQPDIDDHDHGLAHDLERISWQMIARRRALGVLFSMGGAALLAGCRGGGGSSASSSSTSSVDTGGNDSGSSNSSSGSGDTTSGTCIADPSETAGPYPADGTNTSSGATSNVLTESGIVRSDVRKSFISTSDDAGGVLVTLTITLVDSSNDCQPLEGHAIYFWQVDRTGEYSLYGAPTESYLQVSRSRTTRVRSRSSPIFRQPTGVAGPISTSRSTRACRPQRRAKLPS